MQFWMGVCLCVRVLNIYSPSDADTDEDDDADDSNMHDQKLKACPTVVCLMFCYVFNET